MLWFVVFFHFYVVYSWFKYPCSLISYILVYFILLTYLTRCSLIWGLTGSEAGRKQQSTNSPESLLWLKIRPLLYWLQKIGLEWACGMDPLIEQLECWSMCGQSEGGSLRLESNAVWTACDGPLQATCYGMLSSRAGLLDRKCCHHHLPGDPLGEGERISHWVGADCQDSIFELLLIKDLQAIPIKTTEAIS